MVGSQDHGDDATGHYRHHHCNFPVSRAEPPRDQKSFRYLRIPIVLDDDGSQEKGQRARETQTQGQVLLPAWAVLLHKYTGSDVVSFATFPSPGSSDKLRPIDSVAGEEDCPGAEKHSGRCSPSILRYRVSEDARLQDVCEVSRELLTAADWARGASVNTAVNLSDRLDMVSCGQQDKEDEKEKLPNVELKPGHRNINDYFDLILEASASRSSFSIRYRTSAIRHGYATTISRSFQIVLRCMTSGVPTSVAEFDITDHKQEQQMLSWNPPDPFAAQVNACMHDLVSAKAEQMPHSEAVCSWEGSLTYLELDCLSRVAADRLQSVGVRPGQYVPFAYEKSIWAVVAMLAILKAGGAFVPLNPQDPKARLEQILLGVNAQVAVTSEVFEGLFRGIVKEIVVVSQETVQSRDLTCSIAQNGHVKTLTRITCPEDPIFVLFTSGSTGAAKGMIHTHRSSCTHAFSHGRAMGYHGARVLQFAAYTFDVAIFDVFTTLLFGGCICVPSEEERRNGIVNVIRSLRADHAIFTPSFAGVIDSTDVPTIKTMAVGGEALPQERIHRWAEKVRLIQIYGPAEVGICLTMEMRIGTRPETVGHPLDNSSCWLVDPTDSDRLVPIGAVGELVIAGPSLAQGYLNDAARTARSFIAPPIWAQRIGLPYNRFYKAGDLLRYNLDALDGTFDFIGRKDAQIKLRGQRLEPGEIEYHIGHLPEVTVCMVTRPECGCFAGELIAVVQLHNENDQSSRVRDEPLCLASVQSLRIDVVRQYLENLLPGYMIPSACLLVKCMPFVPSLKVDRRRVDRWLADMQTRPAEIALSLLDPLNHDEKTALALSTKISEYVAVKDRKYQLRLQGHDFRLQDVGIDSIQIILLSLFLQREYAVTVPMNVLLSSTLTIRDLSRLIDTPSIPWVNGSTLHPSQELTHLDIRQEAALLSQNLLDQIGPQPQNISLGPRTPTRNVLVTGATGYLGTAILHRLLASPNIHVYALVRCSDVISGLQRLRDAVIKQGWWQESYATRIHVWKGDITQPNLGLGEQEQRQILGHSIGPDDAIHALIHSAARVHYSSGYDALKSVNITATLSALQLAAQAAFLETFVFVSGGVSPSYGNSSQTTSSSSPSSSSSSSSLTTSNDPQLRDASGYTQTKLVAEAIVERFMDSPLFAQSLHNKKTIRIVKPGYIIGPPGTGRANTNDFIWRLVAGCVEIAAYNADDAARWLYVADVDIVAGHVVGGIIISDENNNDDNNNNNTISNKKNKNAIIRITTGLPLSTLWSILSSKYGYTLTPLPQNEWLSRLRSRIVKVGTTHTLFPLLHILERDQGVVGEVRMMEEEGKESRVKEAVERNVGFLIRVGFLRGAGG